MTAEGYEAFDDPYLYPGTSVLRNLHQIKDAKALEAFEVEMSSLRAEQPLPEGNFDSAHYRAVHHHLFQDVYDWAGKYRTVRIAKGSSIFCYPENIPAQMDAVFGTIECGERFRGVTADEFVVCLAGFLAEMNAIHPFREGNGRSQLSFIGLIGHVFDQPLHLERVDQQTFLPAMIASFAGDPGPLIAELRALRRTL
jgi:cell filamentation protein